MRVKNLCGKTIKKIIIPVIMVGLTMASVLEPVKVSHALTNEFNKMDCIVDFDSTIYFGNYLQNDTNGDGDVNELDSKDPIEWEVLSVEDGKVLLMSVMNIDAREFDIRSNVTWKNSELRTWLNQTFFNTAFSINEQSAIIDNTIVTKGEVLLGTEDISTTDKVYVPSYQDVINPEYGFDYEEYEDPSRVAFNTYYTATKAGMFAGGESDVYWLRNNGQDGNLMAVTMYGALMYQMPVDTVCGIRPMILVDANKIGLEVGGNDSGNNTNDNNQIDDNKIMNLSVIGQENYDYAYEVLEIVNETRTKLGYNALSMDKSLLETAMQRAAEISIYYSHTRPNDEECFSIFRDSLAKGENIAMGQMTPMEVMNDWIESPGHYSNIIDIDFSSIGIGCFLANDGRYYWVQCFDDNGSIEPDIKGGKSDSTRIVSVKEKYTSEESYEAVSISCSDLNKVYNIRNYIEYDFTDFLFTSDNSNVADIDTAGNITFKNFGVAVITAISKENPSISFVREFTVNNHSYVVYNVEPTYTEQGYLLHQCSGCGFSWGDNYTPKLEVGDGYVNDNVINNVNIPNNNTNNNPQIINPNILSNSGISSAVTVKKPSKVKIISAKNIKYEAIKLKWKKQKGCFYNVQLSTKKNFSKKKKSGSSFGNSKIWFDLKKGKTYYVRVRAYKCENDKIIYGPWSTVRKIKIRK